MIQPPIMIQRSEAMEQYRQSSRGAYHDLQVFGTVSAQIFSSFGRSDQGKLWPLGERQGAHADNMNGTCSEVGLSQN